MQSAARVSTASPINFSRSSNSLCFAQISWNREPSSAQKFDDLSRNGTKPYPPPFPYKISAQADENSRFFSAARISLIVHRRNLSRFKFPFDRSLLACNRSSSRRQCYRSDVRENGNNDSNEPRSNGSLISVITNDLSKHHPLSLFLSLWLSPPHLSLNYDQPFRLLAD